MLRSKRISSFELEKEKIDHIKKKIENPQEDLFFKVVNIPKKGRGIVVSYRKLFSPLTICFIKALRKFSSKEFLLEYNGEMLSGKQAKEKEAEYRSTNVGSYMLYFKHRGSTMW